MRGLVLVLALALSGCAMPIIEKESEYRERMDRPRQPRETALAGAITDAWQARTFRQTNRWKRSRRACRIDPNQVACDALAKKHRVRVGVLDRIYAEIHPGRLGRKRHFPKAAEEERLPERPSSSNRRCPEPPKNPSKSLTVTARS